MKKILIIIIGIIVIITGLALAMQNDPNSLNSNEPTKSNDPVKPNVLQDSDVNDNARCKGDALCLNEKVTRIVDGDTIYLEGGYKIRLSLTNTPERHEIGFYDASKFTAEMCPVGTTVLVDQDDLQPYDVYDRLLGKVVCGGEVLNSELLYAGHANILTRYCHTSEFAGEAWAQYFGC